MWDFLTKDIWHVQTATLSRWKASGYRLLRILMLTIQGFTKSQIQQGASALTYYSMLGVVPVIALLVGIARGFLFEQTLQSWLFTHFAEQKEIIAKIFKYVNNTLQATSGGVIAWVSISLLLWAAMKILLNIELVMNQIWEVKKGRSLAKRFTDYMAMLFLAPILIFLASGLTGYMSALLSVVKGGKLTPLLIPMLSVLSFLLTSLFFTFLYIFIPNTRVRFLAALSAGIFTGIVYQVLQWLYFYFQIGVASYNAIYGTFAAIPLFLIWLHLSWVIILLGAKFCFAVQNVDAYEFISDIHLSHRFRLICALRITQYCMKKFVREESLPTATELSNRLAIPLPLTTRLLYQLVGAEVLVEVKRERDQEEAYQPAKSPDTLTIKRTIDMINERGEVIPLPPSNELTIILKSLEKFSHAAEQSDGNILLKEIL
jgi:membrane protein